MDVTAIRNALATALRTVVDASGAQLESTGYAADSVDPPWAYVADMVGRYDASMDGLVDLTATVRLITSQSEDRRGQELLDAFLKDSGPTSVKAAIEADPTLGGLCSDLEVAGWDGYRPVDIGGVEKYGADLTVVIYA